MHPRRCPCGTGETFSECCGRLHAGTATAATAEQLMRSRYSAFSLGDTRYLLHTWHPSTRPPALTLDPQVRWTGLDVLATTGGALLDSAGTVEFAAHYTAPSGIAPGSAGGRRTGTQHERSRFLREAGRWTYLDGVSLG